MTQLLHIDASPRALQAGRGGSHTRQLSARFIERWRKARPNDRVLRRDVGLEPPRMVTGAFIEAAFCKPARRSEAMTRVLAESDLLVDELLASDLLVIGVPMHNFGPPAQLKAYIDNIVRVGRTFGFDRSREGVPYFPLLSEQHKRVVLLSARGDFGYEPGQPNAHMNHVEPSIRTALGYIGIDDIHSVAIEFDEFSDARLAASILAAEHAVDSLVDTLVAQSVG